MFSDQFIFIGLFYIKNRKKKIQKLFFFFFKKNVKGDPKNIGLENICRKFLCEKKQLIVLTIFILFFIFHKVISKQRTC